MSRKLLVSLTFTDVKTGFQVYGLEELWLRLHLFEGYGLWFVYGLPVRILQGIKRGLEE
jgi:hypothetical protein